MDLIDTLLTSPAHTAAVQRAQRRSAALASIRADLARFRRADDEIRGLGYLHSDPVAYWFPSVTDTLDEYDAETDEIVRMGERMDRLIRIADRVRDHADGHDQRLAAARAAGPTTTPGMYITLWGDGYVAAEWLGERGGWRIVAAAA